MARPGPKQKQMGVALPEDLRKMLEDACAGTNRSIAEEIRDRLWRTFKEDWIGEPLRNFMTDVGILASLTQMQTGHDWRTHPAASAVLRHAINARLARTKESGLETFTPDELPSRRWVAAGSDDPQTMGAALEARLQGLAEQLGENPKDRQILWDITWRWDISWRQSLKEEIK
jgi:hypothetical protein